MPKLTEKEFAAIHRQLGPNATREELFAAADKAAANPGLLKKGWDWLNTPLVEVPNLEEEEDDYAITRGAKKVANFVGDVAEGFTSPIGLATAAAGGAGAAAGARGLLGISKAARNTEAALNAPAIVEGLKNLITGEGAAEKTTGAIQAALGGWGVKSARTHAFPMKKVKEAYMMERDLPLKPSPTTDIDPARSMRIADAYEAMPHTPDDPQVAAAYRALGDETSEQFQFLRDRAGVKMEPWKGAGQPYANSQEMVTDLQKNNHLWYFPSESGLGQGTEDLATNPLLRPGKSGVPLNDEFRAVHDAFGHGVEGNPFGPRGEEQAWAQHSQMFTPTARKALTTETRGQNSWVNFGPQMRDAEGNLIQKGQPGWKPQTERAYAPQKTGLLPDEFSEVAAGATRASMPQMALGVAAPAAAPFVDTGDPELDATIRAGLMATGAAALGATVVSQMTSPVTKANTLAAGQAILGKSDEEIAAYISQHVPELKPNALPRAIAYGRKHAERAVRETGGEFTNTPRMRELVEMGAQNKDWYAEGPMLKATLKERGLIASPQDEKVWDGILGAMGAQNPPKGNFRDAFSLFQAYKAGTLKVGEDGLIHMPKGWNPDTPGVPNVVRALKGEEASGRKINTYTHQLAGDPGFENKLTADRWHGRLHGFPADSRTGQGFISDPDYEMMEQLWQKPGEIVPEGWTTQQGQAAGWFGIREKAGEEALKAGKPFKKGQQGYPMLQQFKLLEAEDEFIKEGLFKRKVKKLPKGMTEEKFDLTPKGRKMVMPKVKEILKATNEMGGSTVNLHKGNLWGAPHDSVSLFPERTMKIPQGAKLTEGHLKSFIIDNLDLLKSPRLSIGTWVDDGVTWVDIVATPPQGGAVRPSLELGKKYGQKAAFDLQHGIELPTGGSGRGDGNMPHLYDRLSDVDRLSQQAEEEARKQASSASKRSVAKRNTR